MNIEIINRELKISLHGLSGKVINENYGETGVALMDDMWRIIQKSQLKNKGINIWVYDDDMIMMAGVELEELSRTFLL